MTVLLGQINYLPGLFTELNPWELPITTLLTSRGYTLMPQKHYGYTYHSNDAHVTPTPTLQADLGSANFGSTNFTSGSNCMQVWEEGAAVSYFRMNEQNLSRTFGWQGPSNASREENPMARALAEAAMRIKYQLEYVAREGVYNNPNDGGSGTYKQRGYRYAPGITNTAIGVAGGSAVGSYATLTLTKIIDTMQTLWQNKVNGSDQLTFVCNAVPKRQLTDIFRDQYNAGKNSLSRTEAGISIESFLTDFGQVDVLLTRTIPATEAYLLNLSQMRAVAHDCGKGFMFMRDLPTISAGVSKSIYAELGVDHGHGSMHARFYGIGSTAGHLTTGTVQSA
jgi:hypothetical protein